MKQTYLLRRTLSTLLLLFVTSLAWAYKFKVDGIYYDITNSDTDQTVSVTSGEIYYSGDVIIPSTVTHEGKTYNVTNIGDYAFFSCYSLTSIIIPESVTSIRSHAFVGCSSLTSIIIPESVTSIHSRAFEICSSLTTVICRAENIPVLAWHVFMNFPLNEATLYVPASALEDYKQAEQWKEFGTILPIKGTGIESPTAEQGKDTDAAYYTLDGKHTTPVRGRIYIRGGKKELY